MKKQTEYWLKMAKDDLEVISEIIDRKDLTHMVAFHSQQAVEKSLKAALQRKEEMVPKSTFGFSAVLREFINPSSEYDNVCVPVLCVCVCGCG